MKICAVEIWQYDTHNDLSRSFMFRGGEMTPERRACLIKTWDGDSPWIGDHLEVCAKMFHMFNQDGRPTARTSYSLSMGDVVVVDRKAFLVEFGFEFKEIPDWR